MTIYIGNLSFQAEQEHLFDLFSEYGEVKNCSLPLDRETGRKRGFAFVEMVNDADEQKAIDDLQDVEWMGRMIRVSKATPRSAPAAPVVVVVVTAAEAQASASIRSNSISRKLSRRSTPSLLLAGLSRSEEHTSELQSPMYPRMPSSA